MLFFSRSVVTVESVVLWAEHHNCLRKGFSETILLAFNKSGFRCVDRDAAFHSLLSGIRIRLESRQKSPVPVESRCNPLMATQCFAGGGKSFFLDSVARREFEPATPEDPEMQRFMREAIIVNITFNGQQQSSGSDTWVCSPSAALALRILHS